MNIKEIDGVKYVSFADHNEMLLTAIRLEREACAKHFDGSDHMIYRSEVAAAIRARGQ